MAARSLSSRIALWMAVGALVLKGAVPLLASAAAQAQGKAVAEVCTVYGVVRADAGDLGRAASGSLVTRWAQPDASARAATQDPEAVTRHGGDHCALSALAALSLPEVAPGVVPASSPHGTPAGSSRAERHAPDACARWVARLHHAPPAFG